MTQAGTVDDQPIDGSRLCLACGLCCQGLLHHCAVVEDGEVESVRKLGLQVESGGTGRVFALPCPLHREGRCTVYKERPAACRSYQCELLKRYLRGEVTLEMGLRIVERTRELVAAVRLRIGTVDGEGRLWQRLQIFQTGSLSGDADGREPLMLDVAALLALCNRHFNKRTRTAGGSAP